MSKGGKSDLDRVLKIVAAEQCARERLRALHAAESLKVGDRVKGAKQR